MKSISLVVLFALAVAAPVHAAGRPASEFTIASLDRVPDVPGVRALTPSSLPEVLAQVEAPAPAEPSLFQRIWGFVAPTLATAIGTLLVYLLGLLVTWVRSKAGESKFAAFVLPVTEAARAVVLEIDVRLKPKLAKFLEDGVLSEDEKRQLRNEAFQLLKEKLPSTLMAAGQAQLGALFDTFLKGKIEQAVIEKNAIKATTENHEIQAAVAVGESVPPPA